AVLLEAIHLRRVYSEQALIHLHESVPGETLFNHSDQLRDLTGVRIRLPLLSPKQPRSKPHPEIAFRDRPNPWIIQEIVSPRVEHAVGKRRGRKAHLLSQRQLDAVEHPEIAQRLEQALAVEPWIKLVRAPKKLPRGLQGRRVEQQRHTGWRIT